MPEIDLRLLILRSQAYNLTGPVGIQQPTPPSLRLLFEYGNTPLELQSASPQPLPWPLPQPARWGKRISFGHLWRCWNSAFVAGRRRPLTDVCGSDSCNSMPWGQRSSSLKANLVNFSPSGRDLSEGAG